MTSTNDVDANFTMTLSLVMQSLQSCNMLNAAPVLWYCKRQSTVETATFDSEFVAARTPVDQIIDLLLTLMYLGVPINPKATCFGDNQPVVTICHRPDLNTLQEIPPCCLSQSLRSKCSRISGRMGYLIRCP